MHGAPLQASALYTHRGLLHSPPAAARLTRPSPAPAAGPAQNGTTGLMMASQNGHVEVARLLLDRGANVDAAKEVQLRGGYGAGSLQAVGMHAGRQAQGGQ